MNLSNSEIDICVNNNFNYTNIFTFLLPFLNLGNHMFYLQNTFDILLKRHMWKHFCILATNTSTIIKFQ